MQHYQLARINKELINTLFAAQAEETPALCARDEKLSAVMLEVAELPTALSSPESFFTNKFT